MPKDHCQPSQELLEATRGRVHASCVVCGQCGCGGPSLDFRLQEDGSVRADLACPAELQGYAGVLHGGVVSAIADGAMTNCLFAHGIAAVTGELNVRFRHPVLVGVPLAVTARIIRRCGPLFVLEAELSQQGQVKGQATAKFMERSRVQSP